MFEAGNLIIYGNTGVCRVEEVGPGPKGMGQDTGRLYYKLTPVYGAGTIYIPVDTPVFMRPVITRQEADALIARIPAVEEEGGDGMDQRMLADHYRAQLNKHDCDGLVQLIKTVYTKNQTLAKSGRKASKTDLEYKQRAENMLHGELAVALEIPVESVPEYIRQTLAAGEG